MSEQFVKKDVFKIWVDTHKQLQEQQATYQNQILKNLSVEIRRVADNNEETNKNVGVLISLIKDETNLTRKILDQHILEFKLNKDYNKLKFNNLFKRQDTQDKILLKSAPVWKFWSNLSKKGKTILTSVTIAILVLVVQSYYIEWTKVDSKKEDVNHEAKKRNT